jgi:hypothetical protein
MHAEFLRTTVAKGSESAGADALNERIAIIESLPMQITLGMRLGPLNTGDADAHVEITIYFSNRDPVGLYRVNVPARRTKHVRFNDLTGRSRSRAATATRA